MRFAMIGVDRSIGVYDAFVAAGWTPVKLFTPPVDNYVDFNAEIIKRATSLKIPVQMSRVTDRDLKHLAEDGCDILVVCDCPWRIGDWAAHLRYAINFHPSPLPKGRGPSPAVNAVLNRETGWGVSCHKISAGFDEGDVLAQRTFGLSPEETHESISLKVDMAFRALARQVSRDFEALWQNAQPQATAAYRPAFTDHERTLDWHWPVERALSLTRAFGKLGVYAEVSGALLVVRRAVGYAEPHDYRPGTVFNSNPRSPVIAVSDGYIGLLEWQAAPAGKAGQFRG